MSLLNNDTWSIEAMHLAAMDSARLQTGDEARQTPAEILERVFPLRHTTREGEEKADARIAQWRLWTERDLQNQAAGTQPVIMTLPPAEAPLPGVPVLRESRNYFLKPLACLVLFISLSRNRKQ